MYTVPTADALVDYIKDFTGSTNTAEIKQCIFLGELSMRNIELPALRSDPYDPQYIGVVDAEGGIPIPGDMNKPILFFKQGTQYITSATATGTNGQLTITLSAATSRPLSAGMLVTGTGIAVGATIASIAGLVVTLSLANTATVNGTVTFQTYSGSGTNSSQTGPWIVYDRIGDRDIITQGMIAQLYLSPVNVPAVIRGKFSEVAQKYKFLPYAAEGDLVNMYYYKAWPILFSPVADILVSATGTVASVAGASSPWTVVLTNLVDTAGVVSGDRLTATDGTGTISNGGVITVASVDSATQLTVTVTGGTIPTVGNITNIKLTDLNTQTNPVLQTWPEGYIYSTLREYYIKRHNESDAGTYETKFRLAWDAVTDQNNLGKWSGGHTRLSSIWQPRQYRQYNIK
jgi:hypothetical protein